MSNLSLDKSTDDNNNDNNNDNNDAAQTLPDLLAQSPKRLLRELRANATQDFRRMIDKFNSLPLPDRLELLLHLTAMHHDVVGNILEILNTGDDNNNNDNDNNDDDNNTPRKVETAAP